MHDPRDGAQAEAIACALTGRKWSLGRGRPAYRRHAVLLRHGRGRIESGERELPLEAPCIAWLSLEEAGQGEDRALWLAAGSSGHLLSLSDALLLDAVGQGPEAINLRHLAEQTLVVAFDPKDAKGPAQGAAGPAEPLARSFQAIAEETRQARQVSWLVLSAHVSLLLLQLWRLAGAEEIALQARGQARGETSAILQRFRQLLEMRFRDHWPVARYARALGISHDRLHDICRRALGKPPLQLVHERLAHEAELRLGRSVMTVEQIADALGFKDPSHFSQFFKRRTGLPPGTYRRLASRGAGLRPNPQSSYADWP